MTSAVTVAIGIALMALLAGALWGASPEWAVLVAAVIGASVLAWWPVGRAWAVRSLLVWALAVDAGVLFLAYVLWWSVTASPGGLGLAASVALWLAEGLALAFGLGYVWKFVDVRARRSWPVRRGALMVALGATAATAVLAVAAPTSVPGPSAIRAGVQEFPGWRAGAGFAARVPVREPIPGRLGERAGRFDRHDDRRHHGHEAQAPGPARPLRPRPPGRPGQAAPSSGTAPAAEAASSGAPAAIPSAITAAIPGMTPVSPSAPAAAGTVDPTTAQPTLAAPAPTVSTAPAHRADQAGNGPTPAVAPPVGSGRRSAP